MPWTKSPPIPSSLWKSLDENVLPYAGFATSLNSENDYAPEIEGSVPKELRGTLFRNGPGIFDRGPDRKRMLLDGDGMIQAFEFRETGVRYRNRFVKTGKYIAEQEAGRFLFPTWSTLAPRRPWANWGGKVPNQAGVTVCHWNGGIYALDEGHKPYLLSSDLETVGEVDLDPDFPDNRYAAHWKMDAQRREFFHFSPRYGRHTVVAVVVLDAKGSVKERHEIPLPRASYLHDWLVTESHFIFILHPASVSLSGFAQVMLGRRAYADIVSWESGKSNLVLAYPRSGGKARVWEAEPFWVWHGLNAFDDKDEIVADFVAIDGDGGLVVAIDGDGGLGSTDSPLYQVMRGQAPVLGTEAKSHIRRYRLARHGKVREERFTSDFNVEMPYVNPRLACRSHRYGYCAASEPTKLFWSMVMRVDTVSGAINKFDFGDGVYCSEPVVVPRPEFDASNPSSEQAWILTEGYDSKLKKSFLAILESENLSSGPVALVRLSHHVPISFHGFWFDACFTR